MHVQSTDELIQKKCLPCEGGVESCSIEHARQQLEALGGWHLSEDGKMISRKFALGNFVKAIGLLNQIGEVSEAEQHHPDLHLTGYRNLRVDLTTHAIGGLSENDFIVAAKIDAIVGNS